MSQRRTAPSRLPESGDLGPDRLSLESEVTNSIVAHTRQWLACVSATITMGLVGTVHGWTKTSLFHLTSGSDDVPLTLTQNEYSWIVFLTVLGSMIGSLLAAQLADHSGRKFCLLVCSTMFSLGWFIIYVTISHDVPLLYFAGVILGIGVGIAHTINPMFVSEVADIKYRGSISVLIAANVNSGTLLTYALAIWLTYKSQLLILVIISVTSILSISRFPETPYIMVIKGKKKQARKSIAYYKGIKDPHKVKIELRALRDKVRHELHQQFGDELHQQFGDELHQQSGNDLPSQSRSDLPSQSKREAHSDSFWEVVDTEHMSDLSLNSSSDSSSESTSVIHSEVICQVHHQPTDELRLQSPRELHSQSTSELHRPSASELHRPSTSEIHRPSTSEVHQPSTRQIDQPFASQIQRPSTSEMGPPSTSGVHRPYTSEVHPPSTSEMHRPSTSEIHRPSTSGIHRPYTSEVHRPSTSEIHRPSTSEIHRPSISEVYRPSTSEVHPPSTSGIHRPYTSEVHRPSTSEIHRPSTSEIHRPSTSEIHRPSTSEVHRPSTSKIHPPSISEVYRPSTSEVHPPSISEVHRPSTSEVHRPSSSEIHPPPTREIHRPSTSEVHRPSTSEVHRPSTSEVHPPSTSEVHRPSTRQNDQPSASQTQQPSASEIDPPSTSGVHRPYTSEIHSLSTSDVHRPSTSELHRPSTSQILPQTESELDSRSRSDLCTQCSVDSRASTDITETYIGETKYTCLNKLRAILQRSNRKALFIMFGLIMAQQLSGNFTATQYLEELIDRKAAYIDLRDAMILVQVARHVSGYTIALIVEYFRRRTLLFLSTVGSCISFFLVAGYLFLDLHKSDNSTISILPVCFLSWYQVLFQVGLGMLPNVLLCELFPTELKGFVAAIVVIFDGIIGFTASKLNKVIADNVEWHWIFFIFAISCSLAFLMVFIWVPETRGKTYCEIEALLVGENLNSLNEEVRTDEMNIRRI